MTVSTAALNHRTITASPIFGLERHQEEAYVGTGADNQTYSLVHKPMHGLTPIVFGYTGTSIGESNYPTRLTEGSSITGFSYSSVTNIITFGDGVTAYKPASGEIIIIMYTATDENTLVQTLRWTGTTLSNNVAPNTDTVIDTYGFDYVVFQINTTGILIETTATVDISVKESLDGTNYTDDVNSNPNTLWTAVPYNSIKIPITWSALSRYLKLRADVNVHALNAADYFEVLVQLRKKFNK